MEANDLSCRELVELVTDYLEGALTPADRERFDEHVDMCSGCRAYLDEFQATIELSGRLDTELLSEEAREGLLMAFRAWTR